MFAGKRDPDVLMVYQKIRKKYFFASFSIICVYVDDYFLDIKDAKTVEMNVEYCLISSLVD